MIVAFALASWAADSVKLCTDPPQPTPAWAIERTVHLETVGGGGTGVMVSPDGYLLTAAHVVVGDSVTVVFADGSRRPGAVVRRAPDADLLLVRVEATALACMPVEAAPLAPGSDVLVIGSPGGDALSYSVARGIVSGYQRVDGRPMLQTDAAISARNDGGPLVGGGKLAGIVSFKLTAEGAEGLGIAVASSNIGVELSLRWGDVTEAALLPAPAATVVPAPAATVVPPSIETPASEPPDPAVLEPVATPPATADDEPLSLDDPNGKVLIPRKTARVMLLVGAGATGLAALVSGGVAVAERGAFMAQPSAEGYTATNRAYWTSVGFGAAAAGLATIAIGGTF